ncbi:MAG: FAD-binding oxidoreductase [Armatimonadota bacterium]
MTDVEAVSREGSDVTIEGGAIEGLSEKLRGDVLTSHAPDYEEARLIWNGMIDRRPALIARCIGTADVVDTVNFAREHDLLVAVRGGGHNVAGHAVCDAGFVIDLSAMRGVLVDPGARTVRLQGGAQLGDVDRATQLHALATPTGLVSETGVAGLALGGGYGHLRRRFGLTCDNLIGAEVVTAQGEIVRCSADENADLLWGLRGGGGNFGVVTEFELRTWEVGPEVEFVFVLYPLERAEQVFAAYREWAGDAPDEISTVILTGIVPEAEEFPVEAHGEHYVAILGVHSGPEDVAERETKPLRKMVEPIADMSGRIPYVAAQSAFDEDYPAHDLRYYWKSSFVKSLEDGLIERIIERSWEQPSPHSTLDIWQGGGQAARVDESSAAFSGRGAPFMVNAESNWERAGDDDANIAWARNIYADMQEFTTGAMYFNFPGGHEEGDEIIHSTFGDKHRRLSKLKAEYDPRNMFHLNQNIEPLAE